MADNQIHWPVHQNQTASQQPTTAANQQQQQQQQQLQLPQQQQPQITSPNLQQHGYQQQIVPTAQNSKYRGHFHV